MESGEDEATEWLARLRRPDLSDADYAEFADWLAADDAHKEAFDEMLDVWERVGAVGTLDTAPARPMLKVFERPVVAPADTSAKHPVPKRLWPLALAATVLLAVSLILFPRGDRHGTAIGEIDQVALGDGSVITLNTDSEIHVHFSRDERRVELERGEAFFAVSSDTGRPFVVMSMHGEIRVVGTAFGVRQYSSFAEVSVVEGTVSVVPTGAVDAPRSLGAGDAARLDGKAVEVGVVDTMARNAWRDGRLIYSDVSLGDLIDDLNRYFERKMTVVDDQLRLERVAATLAIGDQESMLDALAISLKFKWMAVDDQLIVIQRDRSST